jgi:hypothetical protein
MLVGDDFPELSTDLVAALSTLDVNYFSHLISEFFLISALYRLMKAEL